MDISAFNAALSSCWPLLREPLGPTKLTRRAVCCSLGAGTIIVRAPVSYADFEIWSPMSLIDELLKTGCD
jgi:hypothetical protein